MRENPVWREREHYVKTAHALKDGLIDIKLRKLKMPQWFYHDMLAMVRHTENLIYMLTKYRDEVPKEIED